MELGQMEIESLPEGSVVVRMGAESFVSPWPTFRATSSQLSRLQIAAMLEDRAELEQYRRALVAEVEGEMAREARRRGRFDRVIVPGPASGSIRLGGPALFVDDGRSERVLVTSDVWDHPESGEAMRTCSFLDQAGEECDVKASNLSPCDDLWRALPLAPEALETGKWAGVPRAAEPHRARPVSKAPIMDKFDRVAPIKPEDVRLDIARMTAAQRERLRSAEAKLASAERRKTFRERLDDKGRVIGYGRTTPAEKAERADYKAEMDRLQHETLAANDRKEIDAGRNETLRLEAARGESIEINGAGQAEITSRDGLRTLYLANALSEVQYAAGKAYREIFDATERSLGSCMGEKSGVPDDGTALSNRADHLQTRKRIEAKVQAGSRNGRGLTALRLVAGHGRTIRSIAPNSGANQALYREALLVALDIVADHRGMQ